MFTDLMRCYFFLKGEGALMPDSVAVGVAQRLDELVVVNHPVVAAKSVACELHLVVHSCLVCESVQENSHFVGVFLGRIADVADLGLDRSKRRIALELPRNFNQRASGRTVASSLSV